MEDVFIDIFAYLFRKLGLFTRYAFYYLIGRKQTLKHLDRRQRDPVEFTQRGINICVGIAVAITMVALLVKYL